MNTQERLDRLWNHLLEVEKQTGKPLRKTPRYNYQNCPIENFSPRYNSARYEFSYASSFGDIVYFKGWDNKNYFIYDIEDSKWFGKLSEEDAISINRWAKKKIKEYYDNSKTT
jgi:hypothetical protein